MTNNPPINDRAPARKVRKPTRLEREFEALSRPMQCKIDEAAVRFVRRKRRLEHPDGTFDRAQRWYPASSEGLNTDCYRSPSREYPYSYLLACRTAVHCARLAGIEMHAKLVVMRSRVMAALLDLVGPSR